MSVGWPDVVILGIALIAALKGFKRGFVAELGGTLALAAAVIAGFLYNGMLDQLIESIMHVGVGSSHVIGLIAFALLVYAIFIGASLLLGTIAKLPILGIGNRVAGGAHQRDLPGMLHGGCVERAHLRGIENPHQPSSTTTAAAMDAVCVIVR